MSQIGLSNSETIKQRLFRAREHLQLVPRNSSELVFKEIAWSSYEFCRALELPAVRHNDGHAGEVYLDDAVINFTTVIDYPIHNLDIGPDFIEGVKASQEILKMCQSIPLPALS